MLHDDLLIFKGAPGLVKGRQDFALSWDPGRPQVEVGSGQGVRDHDSGPGLSLSAVCLSQASLSSVVK